MLKSMTTPPRFLLHLIVSLCALPVIARDYRVTVESAASDRAGQVIALTLPSDGPASPILRNEAGRTLAVQRTTNSLAHVVIPWQAAGETLTYVLTDGPAPEAVTVAMKKGDLQIAVSGQPAFHYRTDRTILPRNDLPPAIIRAGYIHPVLSPAGHVVTDDYPSNHAHHHGIWAPWTRTKFQGRAPDFWNMHQLTGAEHFVGIDRTWSGPVHGGFESRHEMMDLSGTAPVKALDVTWRVTAYAVEGGPRPVRLFDLELAHTAATADPLVLPEYHYGGFGFRGAAGWNGPGDAARYLTSEGISDRIDGNNTRARWCYVGGAVEGGAVAGTATLGHPDNFRAPQPVRLHPNMPYFSFVPQQLGEFSIVPGQPYVARFRFIVADGEPDRAFFDAWWNGYATPAKAPLRPLDEK
jgi:hypothetical protein